MPATPDRIRQDRRLIGQTLFKLSLTRLAILAVGIVIAAGIWIYVASWILNDASPWIQSLDQGVGLSWQHILGPSAVSLLYGFINPWLWRILALIWTLIVLYSLKTWILSSLASGRLYTVNSRVLAELRPNLCEEVADVLRWVWQDRSEPFTVGDLQRAHRELRSNRIGKIALTRAQSAILDQGAVGDAGLEEPPRAARRQAEPTLSRTR
ncbi:hypothetical protein [Bordetella sp. FB-8]|uniref:hypothetical protein n=1 Tax=Bordetella sp. FB-8 TaxID=1159870 RepID=UPI0003A82B5F|nr:hypothetical protein [Bordetella sp. FB-8]